MKRNEDELRPNCNDIQTNESTGSVNQVDVVLTNKADMENIKVEDEEANSDPPQQDDNEDDVKLMQRQLELKDKVELVQWLRKHQRSRGELDDE